MEKNNVIPTVGVILFEKESVLLVRHEAGAGHVTGMYGLPSGRIDAGETEQEAAVRELWEETGLRTDKGSLLEVEKTWVGAIERKDGKKLFSWKLFVAPLYEGVLKTSSETTPEWVPIKNIGEYMLLPNVEEAVQEGLKIRDKDAQY